MFPFHDRCVADIAKYAKAARIMEALGALLAEHAGLVECGERAARPYLLETEVKGLLRPMDPEWARNFDDYWQLVLSDLETYGIAQPLQGWRHVLEQGLGPGSPLPVNTHGGHLSEGYIHGLNHITEVVRQLRGTASNQVAAAEVALLGCNGASAAILAR